MQYYEDNKELFEKRGYPVHYHPVQYEFLRCKITIEKSKELRDYLSERNNKIMIRVVRDHETKEQVFLASKFSYERMVQYAFDHIEELQEKFHIQSFTIAIGYKYEDKLFREKRRT